jgi:hypothetical protein
MSCMFSAGGEDFDVEAFLQRFALTPHDRWQRGTERRPGKHYEFSGFSFVASDADMNAFEQQVADTIAFISTHSSWLEAVTAYPGVEYAAFDFGIDMPGGSIPMVRFPPALVSAAGAFGLWLEASLYYTSDPSEEIRS